LMDEVKGKLGGTEAQELIQCDRTMHYWHFSANACLHFLISYCSLTLLLSLYGFFVNRNDNGSMK